MTNTILCNASASTTSQKFLAPSCILRDMQFNPRLARAAALRALGRETLVLSPCYAYPVCLTNFSRLLLSFCPFGSTSTPRFSPMLSATVPPAPRGPATRTTTITTCGATITRRRVRESYDGSCVARHVSQACEA